MSQLKELLDREARRVDAQPDALDEVLRGRDRRERERRIGTVIIALAVFGAKIAYFAGTIGPPRSLPAHPLVPRHNGEIAVRATSGERGSAIIQIDPSTGNEVVLPIVGGTLAGWPNGPVTDLAWSPDGMTLAYVLEDLWLLDVSSGESRALRSCGRDADSCTLAWSPDGSTLAVAQGSEIELLNPDGTTRTTLTPLGSGTFVRDPTWAPDGGRIAFVLFAGGSKPANLYSIGADGSDLRQLVVAPLGDNLGVWMPAWSPDGSKIAYLSSESTADDRWLINVTVVGADGSDPTQIVQAGRCYCIGFTPGLAWSPDGRQMALVIPGPDGEPGGLYVMDADGTDLRLLREGAWARPAWRPVP